MAVQTFEEAKQCVDDPYSCFKLLNTTKHIALPPCYLGKLKTGVDEELNSEIRLFSDSLNGVLIAYDNVKLLQPFGNILDDQPYVHFDIQLDMIIFQPTVGSLVRGVVHKIEVDHVGCLVHGCFNAAILKPEHVRNGWKGAGLTMGQEFILRVVQIETERGVLSMKGVVADIEMSSRATQSKPANHKDHDIDTAVTSGHEDRDTSIHKSEKSKKKKKKKKDGNIVEADKSFPGESGDNFVQTKEQSEGNTKSRKRKSKIIEADCTVNATEKLDSQVTLDSSDCKRRKETRISGSVPSGEKGDNLDGGDVSTEQNGSASQSSSSKRKKSKKSAKKEVSEGLDESHTALQGGVKVETGTYDLSDDIGNTKKKKKSKKSKKKK
ncbi:DNA-directed RNA polymerase I subunit RPA43-like [Ptychodera flava]|uniref:DNA-directed RNA polymerase I subunit RPA43-like n=1 Tax=Ptychodera flava TaxID=63121 RepID=UPI003969E817